MKIQILYVPGCPNLAVARSSVQAALQDAGIHATVEENEVVSFEDAARLGMHGSPTILIDGQDPFAAEDEISWSCRLYRSENGIAGSPTVGQLAAVLAR